MNWVQTFRESNLTNKTGVTEEVYDCIMRTADGECNQRTDSRSYVCISSSYKETYIAQVTHR